MNNYHKKSILQAMDHEELLSEWEIDFIDSLAGKDDNYNLSEKQIEYLNKIGSRIAAIDDFMRFEHICKTDGG